MGIFRILLALSVIISHCGAMPGIQPISGSMAVETFFIVSGFYMTFILRGKYRDKPYGLFITNRLLRIYPIYWCVLIFCCLYAFVIYKTSAGQALPFFDALWVKPATLPMVFLILSNLLIFGQDEVMFMGIRPDDGGLFFTTNFWTSPLPLYNFLLIPQAWSLALELLFYLLAPFVLKRRMRWILLLMAISLLLRLYLYNWQQLRNDPWSYRFFPTELVFFLSGAIAYRIYEKIKNRRLPTLVGAFILLYMVAFTLWYGRLPVFSIACFPFSVNELVFFASIVVGIPFVFHYSKNKRLDNHIGELSYPVYISHLLIARIMGGLPFPLLKESWCIAVVTILFSSILVMVIARPMERYRQGRLHRQP